MYDEEKNPYSHSLAGASDPVDQENTATELTNLNDLDNPSIASAEQFCDEAVEIKNVLETTKTQIEKSGENSQPIRFKKYLTPLKPSNLKCKYQ